MPTRIFLVDDHQLIRQGVRALLESEPDFEVIGEAGDASQAIQAILSLQPDVLIADVVLPGLNGIEMARQVKQHLPEVATVMLSMYDTEAYVFEALQAGALGYVLKISTADELAYAVRVALDGRIFLSPPLDAMDLAGYAQRQEENPSDDLFAQLTEREQQVFRMAAGGMTNPEIALKLLVSVRTVEMHRANMLKKLNLKGQTELVRYALKRGLIDL